MLTYNVLKVYNGPAQLEMVSQRDRLRQEFLIFLGSFKIFDGINVSRFLAHFFKVGNPYNKCIFCLFDLCAEVNVRNDICIRMTFEKCSLFVVVNKVLKK